MFEAGCGWRCTVCEIAMEHGQALAVQNLARRDLGNLAASGRLFAILDAAACGPSIPQKAMEVGNRRAISLYRDSSEQDFWEVAPYLFTVDSSLLEWLGKFSSSPWGIFVASRAELEGLRHHFRQFLRVQSPDGEIWHFRF